MSLQPTDDTERKSKRANTMKNDASKEELIKFAKRVLELYEVS